MKKGSNRRRRIGPLGKRVKKTGKSRSSVKPTSSFATLKPSTASVALLTAPKRARPLCLWHLVGLLALCPFIFLRVDSEVLFSALVLLLPGIALLIRPPVVSPGRFLDWAIVGFLAVLLSAFVPLFYWFDPEWRAVAVDFHGFDLPAVLSIQPWRSLEAWFQVAAGFAWFYAAYSWPLNDNGRRWFFIALSGLLIVLAVLVLWGTQMHFDYAGQGTEGVFSFFAEWNRTAGLLAVGGVASFAFAVKEFQSRSMGSIPGFVAAILCLLAVSLDVPRIGLWLFLAGLLMWYIKAVRRRRPVSWTVVLGFPLILLLLAVHGWGGMSEAGLPRQVVAAVFGLWLDAPLTGMGLGNFAAIAPQYLAEAVLSGQSVRPFNEVLWLLAEVGLLGVGAFFLVVLAYLSALRRPASMHGRSLRHAAAFGLLVFALHLWVATPAREPGLVYLALLLAAVALPPPGAAKPVFRAKAWRGIGLVLILVAALWQLAGIDRLPLYTGVALLEYQRQVEEAEANHAPRAGLIAAEEWVKRAPLDWRAHHWQARFILSQTGAQSEAAAAFDRARFVQPRLGEAPYEEGFYWLPYNGQRALEAWEEALRRELPDPVGAFSAMVAAAEGNPMLDSGLSRISRMDNRFRLVYLEGLFGDALMRELGQELAANPRLGQYDTEQRARVLTRWIAEGDLSSAEAFLGNYPEAVDSVWWFRALAESQKANFASAVRLVREHLPRPEFPPAKEGAELVPVLRLKREFWVDAENFEKGVVLLQILFGEGAYREALAVCDAMLDTRAARHTLHYWRGECLYQLGDYIESWFAFERYRELLD